MEDEDNEIAENEVHTIRYKLLYSFFDQESLLAQSYLQMPSGSNTFNRASWSNSRVIMDLKAQDDNHCLELMMNCQHKNILHARMVRPEKGHLVVWTEPYTDWLVHHLIDMGPDIADSNGMVPSLHLQNIVRQWLDGLEQLRRYGKYHGNFLLENTYYHMEQWGPIVKLTNFKLKEKSGKFRSYSNERFLLQCQLEDVWDVARALDRIHDMVEEWNSDQGSRTLDCTLLIDLAKKLREVSLEDLDSIMEDIKKHMFFWDRIDRGRFYIADLPAALREPGFSDKIEKSADICTNPWDNHCFCGLLPEMNAYRKLHNLEAYDGSKKAQFCSFCTGSYTHEFELPCVQTQSIRVDSVLQNSNPKACYEIACLMPERESKYMLSKREDKK